MPKKRVRRKSTKSRRSTYAKYLLRELFVAIFIIIILLFFFAYSYEGTPVGQAAGSLDSQLDAELYGNVRLCNQGQQYACEKVFDEAS